VSVSALGRDMIEALAALGGQLERSQLAALVGKKESGGYFRNNLSALRTAGIVQGDRTIVLTDHGVSLADSAAALTRGEIIERWRRSPKMGALAWEIWQLLLDAYPDAIGLDDLAAHVEKERSGGYFRNNVSFLRSHGLLEDDGDDGVRAAESLFLVPA
jgi:predicted transcriptional regulator